MTFVGTLGMVALWPPHRSHVAWIGIRSLIEARIFIFIPDTIGLETASFTPRTKLPPNCVPHVWSPYSSVPSHDAPPSSVTVLPANIEPLANVRVIVISDQAYGSGGTLIVVYPAVHSSYGLL